MPRFLPGPCPEGIFGGEVQALNRNPTKSRGAPAIQRLTWLGRNNWQVFRFSDGSEVIGFTAEAVNELDVRHIVEQVIQE